MGKYDNLINKLIHDDKEVSTYTFSEIEDILGFKLCDSARKYFVFWANDKTGPIAKHWLRNGFESFNVDMRNERVSFKKTGIFIQNSKSPSSVPVITKEINSLEDEILIDVPSNLTDLEKDEYLLVKLSKENSILIEKEIANDPNYRHIGEEAYRKNIMKDKDYSLESFYFIINRIATENSTRTSTESMKVLAEYITNDVDSFYKRLLEGDLSLVDDMNQYAYLNGGRGEKSLCSKICRYIDEWENGNDSFTINDSVVRAVLPYYLAYYKIDRRLWFNVDLDKCSYVEFFKMFELLKEKVPELSRHELDHIMWYAYKSDNVRTALACSLSKYI